MENTKTNHKKIAKRYTQEEQVHFTLDTNPGAISKTKNGKGKRKSISAHHVACLENITITITSPGKTVNKSGSSQDK